MTAQFTEAPASFNIKAYSPGGFDIMLTLRAEDGADLMPRAIKALDWLTSQGFTPTKNGHAPAATGQTQPAANGTAPLCPTHQQPMKESKFGGWYCAAKVADDDGTGKAVYCRQKVSA